MNSSTSPSSQPPQPAIPVAMQYARADESLILRKLIRTIGLLMLVVGAIKFVVDPVATFRTPIGGTSLDVGVAGFSLLGRIIVNVLAISGGIAGLRRLRSAARIVSVWSVASLAVGAVLLMFRLFSMAYFSGGRFTWVGTYEMAYVGNSIANFATAAVLPVICLVLLRFPDARRAFSSV